VLVVYGKTDPDAGPRGITAFLIERGLRLLHRAEARQARHARPDTGELVFEDREAPAENVLGEARGA
jgi:isovaleryl-CoA dehydrogenase